MADYKPQESERTAQSRPGGAPLWDSAQALTTEVLELGQILARLLMLELRLTAHHLPRALAAVLGLAVTGWLSWVGLSILLGWAAYAYFGNVGAGLCTFLGLNVAVTLILASKVRGMLREATLPSTRRQLRKLMATGTTQAGGQPTDGQSSDERKAPASVH